MASVTLSLPDPLNDWVQDRIDSGAYPSAGDYLRDLIRQDQAEADRSRALLEALTEGEGSGISSRTVEDILADFNAGSSFTA